MIRQTEAAECGLAYLAMVVSHHGYESDLASLRRRLAISLKGSTLKGLVQIASSMGLGSRAVRCELSALGELKLPAILHWDMNHFVVLSKVQGGRLFLQDPALGSASSRCKAR